MSWPTFEELVERVGRVTGLDARLSSIIALKLADERDERADAVVEPDTFDEHDANQARVDELSTKDIIAKARELGYEFEVPKRPLDVMLAEALTEMQMQADPAEVLKSMYAALPRSVPLQPGHDKVEIPRVGRAPKESVFYDEELREQIEALPDEVKVLIGGINVFEGSVTFTLYDEANDLDREIGPIDLTRYADGDEIRGAINVLLSRIERVLAADSN